MKSLEELKAIREKTRNQIIMRKEEGQDSVRIVIGMATCGIAAGARPVLSAAVEHVSRRNLENVSVTQTGCIGICRLEPVVEIFTPGQEKVTYVKMTAEKMEKVISEHIVNNHVVSEYTIGAAE